MAKMKLLKLPRAPKATASVAVKERWFARYSEIKKENARREKLNRKSEELSKKIQKAISGFKK